MAPTNRKKTVKKPKEPRAETVLVTPRRPQDVHTTTRFELFRLSIDGKPRVAMRINDLELLAWDRNGDPMIVDVASASTREVCAFIDYLTEEEGVYIPGSAEDRVVVAEREKAMPAQVYPIPSTMEAIDEIPDGVTFLFAGEGYGRSGTYASEGWDARNFSTKRNGRITLLFRRNAGRNNEHVRCGNNGYGWGFKEYVEEHDEARWLNHSLRKTMGVD